MPIPFLVGLAKMAATAFATSTATSLVEELMKDPSDEEIQERWQQFLDELRGELEETKRQLEHEQRKRKKQVMLTATVSSRKDAIIQSIKIAILQSSPL